MPRGSNIDLATRAVIVSLKTPFGGKTTAQIACRLGIPERTINRIYARAIERGFDPNQEPLVLKDEYLIDAPRSGRPKKRTDEVINQLVQKVRSSTDSRALSCADLSGFLRETFKAGGRYCLL